MTKYIIVEPLEDKWKWRLNHRAEDKVRETGVEVDKTKDFYGQTQRKLKFADGSEYWFYPCWFKRIR